MKDDGRRMTDDGRQMADDGRRMKDSDKTLGISLFWIVENPAYRG
jgi:hypothetical protein